MVVPLEVIIVEDLPSDVELIIRELVRAGFEFHYRHVETGEELSCAMDELPPDLVLTDFMLPRFTGMDTIRIVKEFNPHIPIIVITGSINEEVAVDCIHAGADDYVIKEHLSRLAPAIRHAQERHRLQLEKRRADSQLLYSRDMLGLALMSTNAGMWEVDLTTGNAAYSPSWARLLGYKLLEIIGDPQFWKKVIHPDDMPTILQDFQTHINEKTSFYENRHRAQKKSGEWIWVLSRGKMVTWDINGNPTKMVGTITDISGLVRIEEELLERSNRLDLLNQAAQKLNQTLDLAKIYETIKECISLAMNCTGLIVSEFDAESEIIRCSAACQDGNWLDVSGFPPIPLEPEGKGTQSIVIRSKQPLIIDDYPSQLRTANTSNYIDKEGHLLETVPDNAVVTRSALIVPMLVEGEVTGVIQVFGYRYNSYTDEDLKLVQALAQHASLALRNVQLYQKALTEIANRKQAEETLAFQFSTLQSILESTSDSLYSINCDYLYTSFNHVHCNRVKEFFGVEPKVGESVFKALGEGEYRQTIQAYLHRAIGGEQFTIVQTAGISSLKTKYYEVSFNPIFNNQRAVVGASVFSRDITSRMQTEREFEMLYSVSTAIHESSDIKEALEKTVAEFCVASGWVLGEAWVPEGFDFLTHLPCYHHPSLPQLETFNELSREMQIFPGVGLPGTTWARKAPVWVQDIITENASTFLRQKIAEECGLHTGFGIPVMVGAEVVAVLCFFMNDVRQADHHLLDLVNNITQQLSEFYQKKLAEEALRESERQYRMLFQKNPSPMWIYEFDSLRFIAINDAAIQKYGYSFEEIMTMTARDIFATEDVPRLEKVVAENDRGLVTLIDWRHKLKDGTLIYVDIIANNIEFLGRRARIAIAFDVTERKHTEAERLRLFTAVEQISETVVIADAAGTIQYVNPYFEKATGYTRDEVIGNNPRFLKSGQHDQTYYQTLWSTLSSGNVWHGLLVNKRKDGTYFSEDATITPVLDVAGNITNYIAVKRDLTRERQLEEQLHQSQKLEAIGRLAGGVAHDFNNLLTVVNSNAELMVAEMPQDNPLYEGLRTIQEMVDRGSALTRQLLTFSRRQIQEMKLVSLNEICLGVTKLLRRLIREDIELRFELTDEPTTIKADSGQIEQVLMNLVVNARDAMPSGGTLTIATRQRNANVTRDNQPGRFVVLTVSDTGIGMTKEVLERVLEPFFTTKPVGKGTGLGLSTVHGIVTQSGGTVTIASEVNKGTVVTVELPFSTEIFELAVEPGKPKNLLGNETILLVDDEPMILEMVKRILELKGYVVHTAENGQKALDRYAQLKGRIDLLITDVVMPHMGGAKLVDEIHIIQPDLKVLFISGYTTEDSVHQIQDLGIPLLYKPFGSRDLIEAVRNVLDTNPS
ncbi:MAG: PAS domain S-box protein [bacterium]|nr:PAS domain S-box protein [bacterium]